MHPDSSGSRSALAENSRGLHGVALAGVLIALMLTLLLEALDQTIVGTAMPRIIGQLHGLDRYTWTVTAYLLASTTLIPIAGKLSDQFGRKWFLLGGVTLFLLGSALCGAAQTIDYLIVFRALQGAGAGMGIALVFTAVGDLFPPIERAKWQGVVGGVYGFSSVVGPTLGGWLADHGPLLGPLVTDASRWRWVFYINLPLGLAALTALSIYLPADLSVRSNTYTGWAALRRIDVAGATVAAAATLCLLLGLTWGGEATSSWGTPRVIGALAGAGILYTGLFIVEQRAVEPILPLNVFRDQVFAANAALSLLLNMALLGTAFYVPLFLQGVLGASATQAGTTMTPFSVSIAVGTALAGMAIAALKRYHTLALLGTLTMTVGIVLLTRVTPTTGMLHMAILVATAGLGMGVLFSVVGIVALNTLPATHLGAGMGAVRYLGQIGGALGAAIVGTVVNLSLASDLGRRLPAAAIQHLAADGVTVAANPQVLVSATYRATLVNRAIHIATARLPAGSQHDRLVTATTLHVQQLLMQVFDALRLSLALAIQHGLAAALVFSSAAILAALFVTDVPLAPQPDTRPAESSEAPECEIEPLR